MKFPSFPSLQSIFKLPSSELPQYLQIQDLYASHYSLNTTPPSTVFKHICISSSRDRGLISQIYNFLNNLHQPKKSALMLHWEADLDCSFPIETWYKMIDNLHKSNMAAAFRESRW